MHSRHLTEKRPWFKGSREKAIFCKQHFFINPGNRRIKKRREGEKLSKKGEEKRAGPKVVSSLKS